MSNYKFGICMIALFAIGCADEDGTSSANSTGESSSAQAATEESSVPTNSSESMSEAGSPGEFEFKPLSASSATASDQTNSPEVNAAQLSAEQTIQAVMSKLKPLQVMLGQWRGTTRKEFDGFKAVDSHEWIWDLRGDPSRPALAVSSDKSPYLRTAKLTWEPGSSEFRLSATDADGVMREYAGDYTDPVHEIIGPDDKPHRVFRLEFTQTPESTAKIGGEAWQIAFAQQENNRYLLEVAKRRGTAAFRRYDTVSTQREGTSFAISDSDYGEKTCIISQGLGTTPVTWKGKTYWVCCSGCKAAFEDDPETWIARAEKRAAEKKQ